MDKKRRDQLYRMSEEQGVEETLNAVLYLGKKHDPEAFRRAVEEVEREHPELRNVDPI